MSTDKVIVTNFQALTAKYKAEGVSRIKEALKPLIEKDAVEAVKTQIVDLSNATQMTKLKGKAVTASTNEKQAKAAIDAIYKALTPAYIMILGAPDVIPQQSLKNPVADPESGDPDEIVPSDIPYACDAPYSTDPTKFIGPTRVLGRLPDIVKATRPDYLVQVIGFSAGRTSRPAKDYAGQFGISAFEWQDSTKQSVQKIFGPAAKIQTSPQKGPEWTDGDLSPRAHFINCHGSSAKPVFYGQKGESYPVAHGSKFIAGKITEGTVASVECCYGGQLYDPELSQKLMGLCQAYLSGGAYGFCGSSTVAYGPATGNAQADLLCQYFLQQVLAGSSLGRAMLEARQKFAQGAVRLDPYDLKTLVQFNLLGDPSIHPVAKASSTKPVGKSFALAADASPRAINRDDRRILLARIGDQIQRSQLVAKIVSRVNEPAKVAGAIRKIARELGISEKKPVLTFEVESADANPAPKAKLLGAAAAASDLFHVIAERRKCGTEEGDFSIVGAVAREVDGEIVSFRKVFSR